MRHAVWTRQTALVPYTPVAMSKGCILVVDDNPDNRRILQVVLRRAGYTVRTAASGPEAIEIYTADPIDVALIDLAMPEMDGIALLAYLRQLNGNLQAIVITAYGSVERAVEAMKAGALDFLTRPVRNEVLLAQVEKALALNA